MSIDDSTWSNARRIRNKLDKVADAHTRAMAAGWAAAWDMTVEDLDAALAQLALQAGDGKIKRSTVIKSERLRKALGVIEGQLTDLFDESAQTAIKALPGVVDDAGVGQVRLIVSQLPKSERAIVNGWSTVSAGQVDAIVARSAGRITKASYPLSAEATASMKRELVRGLINGQNPRETARLMVKRTEGIFNGGLSRALTISRTEILDAHRAGGQLAEQANADILDKWIWSATLSARTCPACWGMNGREFPISQAGPEGHQSCRCARVAKAKTWAELGFDIKEPPSLLPDSQAAFDALPKSDKIGVLGRKKYDAWKSGDFPINDWATKKKNPGWRDSWVQAPTPVAA